MSTNLFAFQPFSYTATFTANVAAPTPVQVTFLVTPALFVGTQFRIINSGTSLVTLGWGTSAAIASINAASVAPTAANLPLLPGTDEILTLPAGSFFTGISAIASIVYITAGEGN